MKPGDKVLPNDKYWKPFPGSRIDKVREVIDIDNNRPYPVKITEGEHRWEYVLFEELDIVND